MAIQSKKVRFCKYSYNQLIEIGFFHSNYYKEAEKCLKLFNDSIAGPDGTVDNEFYFLDAKVKDETRIITLNVEKDYPSKNPSIIAALRSGNEVELLKGNKNKRGTQPDWSNSPVNPLITITHIRTEKSEAEKMTEIIPTLSGKKAQCMYSFVSGKHTVHISSYILNQQELYELLNEAKKKLKK